MVVLFFIACFFKNDGGVSNGRHQTGARLMGGRQRVHIHNLSRYNGNGIVVIAVRFCAPDKKINNQCHTAN